MRKRVFAAVGIGAAAGVAAIAAARRRAPDVPLPRLLEGERSKFQTSDGAILEVHVAGTGPTVVLAHCWTGDMRIWEPVAARLVSRGHKVVRYDQRGHGSSTVGAGGLAVSRLGDDLAELLEELDVRDAVLAGHSMGGMTVQSLAIEHRELAAQRARALVLVATASKNEVPSRGTRIQERAVGSPALDRAMSAPFGHVLVRGAFGKQPTPAAVRLTRDTFVGTSGDMRAGFLTELLAMDLVPGLPTISLPTTVVVGTRDTVTPMMRARTIAGSVPGARLVVLEGLGHMLPLEATDRVADLIVEAAA